MKVERGCEKDSSTPDKWQIDNYNFQRCPKKIITPDTIEYLQAYRRYNKGYLPNMGGWFDQPAKFNDVIDIIESEVCKIENKKTVDTK